MTGLTSPDSPYWLVRNAVMLRLISSCSKLYQSITISCILLLIRKNFLCYNTAAPSYAIISRIDGTNEKCLVVSSRSAHWLVSFLSWQNWLVLGLLTDCLVQLHENLLHTWYHRENQLITTLIIPKWINPITNICSGLSWSMLDIVHSKTL